MNPYRAGLVAPDTVWPGWREGGATAWSFLALARPGPCPQPEWLAEHEGRVAGLEVGAD